MTRVFNLTYDLNRPGQDYRSLFEAIKSYGSWCHYEESAWMIASQQSAAQIRDHLWQHMDRNDALMVARVSGETAWQGLSAEISQWLKGQLDRAA